MGYLNKCVCGHIHDSEKDSTIWENEKFEPVSGSFFTRRDSWSQPSEISLECCPKCGTIKRVGRNVEYR